MADAIRNRTISLRRFWARRVRRLLPAAIVVILLSGGASLFILSPQDRVQMAQQAIASALWIENWFLAAQAVDYLGAESAPTPFQHFWSLSVEEQFYLVWPLLLLAAIASGRSVSASGLRLRIGVLVGVVFVASLLLSVYLTNANPTLAYFATPVRAWEFAAGALVAVVAIHLPRASALARGAIWSAGVAAILLSSVLISAETPFPGSAAMLPVFGALMALAVAPPPARAPFAKALAPVGRVGDLSYSIYLWHWPLIVLLSTRVDVSDVMWGALIVGFSILLAWCTERWIERPFRFGIAFAAPGRAIAIVVVGASLVAIPAASFIAFTAMRAEDARLEAASVENCLGAASLLESDSATCSRLLESEAVYPPLESRLDDTAGQYSCYLAAGERFSPCGYGPQDSVVRIAIVGDSHAASWVPALLPAVEQRGWRLDVLVGNGCQLIAHPECDAGEDVIDTVIDGDYDLVLATAWRRSQPETSELTAFWARLVDQGVRLAVIADVPHNPESTDACVAAAADLESLVQCSTPRSVALTPRDDSYSRSAQTVGVPVVDFTDFFCDPTTCPALIGRAVVYRDSPYSHITATFSRSMYAPMEAAVVELLAIDDR